MSIPKSKRSESRFQILADVKKLRNMTLDLMLRDFGVRSRKRIPDYDAKVMSDDDSQIFTELLEKYNITSVPDQYPDWFISKLRDRVIDDVFELVELVEFSNIYPQTVWETNSRRNYQNQALSKLYNLYQWFELAGTVLPISLEKLNPYFNLIDKSVASIKSLRKYDNKVRKAIIKKDRDVLAKAIHKYIDSENAELTEGMIDKLTILMSSMYRYAHADPSANECESAKGNLPR